MYSFALMVSMKLQKYNKDQIILKTLAGFFLFHFVTGPFLAWHFRYELYFAVPILCFFHIHYDINTIVHLILSLNVS